MNWPLLQNSLLVSGATTAAAVAIGFVAALWLACLSSRAQRIGLALAVIALVLPPFLVTNCWLHYLGHTGVWRDAVPWSIFSFRGLPGTILILTLLLWPIPLVATLSAWRRLEPAQLEIDPLLSGGALIRWLLFPMAKPALATAAVLTFVLALNNFAVPAILQVKVFPAEVWVHFSTTFDYRAALWLGWPLIGAPVLLLLWFRRREVEWPHVEGRVSATLFRRRLGATWFRLSGGVTILVLLLAVGLPLWQLAGTERTWTELPKAWAAAVGPAWNSCSLAALTATLCAGIGLALWRLRIGGVLWLPFLVPGIVLGMALIWLLNRPISVAVYQSFGVVIIGLTLRYLAPAWSGVAHALRSTDRDLTDAARLEGASRWQVLRHAQWPQIAPAVAAAWYVAYLLALWDVETLVLIVPPGGETLALRVFNLLHYGHNAHVNALCLLLLLLAVAPLFLAGAFVKARAIFQTATHGHRVLMNASTLIITATGILLTGCAPGSTANVASLDSRLFARVEIIGTRGTGVGQFNKPRSLAVDSDDNLYVVDLTGRVQKFSPDGTFLLSWQMPQTDLGKPKGMCRDAAGNIIVIEPHYSRVNHHAPDGRLVAQWGEHGTGTGQLMFPRAAAVNSFGEIYVSEYSAVERVQRFKWVESRGSRVEGRTDVPAVTWINSFGKAGDEPGEFNRPEGLCVDAADRVYVADSCNHRIQVFSRDGGFLRAYGKAGSGPGEMSYPYDVRVDEAGRQYVCEFGNSRIQIFDANDRLLETLGGAGAEPGQLANPWSIALDSRGNLYVADSQNHRVQKFVRKQSVVRGELSVVEEPTARLAGVYNRPLTMNHEPRP